MPRKGKNGDTAIKKVEKPPEIYMIATVFNANKQLIGARLIDINDKRKKYQDVSITSCINVLKNNPLAIKNIRLVVENNQLRLVNGALNNLTKIDAKGKPMEAVNYNGNMVAKTPILVINQISNLGYTVLNYKGELRKVAIDKLLDEIKVVGIANGAIVYKPEINMDFIVGIEEPYEIVEISKSKVGSTGMAKMRMAMPGANASIVAKNASVDIENQINYSDVFSSLNPGQKKCIQNYYMWYTVDMYKSLAKTTKFELAVSKAEKLAQLREDKNWEFGGIVDSYTTGLMGQSKCSLGHNIRYEYHAVVFDDNGDITDRIIFGETCSSDFFSISVEDMRKLVKVRKKMSDEIETLTDAVTNNKINEMWDGVKLLRQCIDKIGPEKTEKVFGDKIGKTLLNYIEFNVPFPESLVKLARAVAYGGVKEADGSGKKFWSIIFPEHKSLMDKLYSYVNTKNKYYYMSEVLVESCKYIDFMCFNRLDGVYAYDPLLKVGKGEGGFNAKTREERTRLLRNIQSAILCKEFSLEEIEDLLITLETLVTGLNKIYSIYPKSAEDINEFRSEVIRTYENNRIKDYIEDETEFKFYINRFCYYFVVDPKIKYYSAYKFGDRIDKHIYSQLPVFKKVKDFKNSLINMPIDFLKYKEYLKIIEKINAEDEKAMLEEQEKIEKEAKEKLIKEEKERQYRKIANFIDNKLKEGILVENNQTFISVFKDKDEKGSITKLEQLLVILVYKDNNNLLCVTNQHGKYRILNYMKLKELSRSEYSNYYESLAEKDFKELLAFCDNIENGERNEYIASKTVEEKVTTNERIFEILKEMDVFKINKLDDIKKYFREHNIDNSDSLQEYYDKICFDICNRNVEYNDLSYKQKYIVDKVYKKLCCNGEAIDDKNKEQKDSNELPKLLLDKINFILSNTDTSTELGAKIAERVNNADKIGINICKTVKRTGKVSEKQLKHINKVYNIVRSGA